MVSSSSRPLKATNTRSCVRSRLWLWGALFVCCACSGKAEQNASDADADAGGAGGSRLGAAGTGGALAGVAGTLAVGLAGGGLASGGLAEGGLAEGGESGSGGECYNGVCCDTPGGPSALDGTPCVVAGALCGPENPNRAMVTCSCSLTGSGKLLWVCFGPP